MTRALSHPRPSDTGSVGPASSAQAAEHALPPPRRSPARLVAQILKMALPAALLGLLCARVGTEATTAAIAGLTPVELVGALVLGALATTASAARWCVVARAIGLALPLRRATLQVYRSTLANAVLPAGVLGDVHRAVAQRRHDGTDGIVAVALERVAGQIIIATAALALAAPAFTANVLDPLLTASAAAAGGILPTTVVGALVVVSALTAAISLALLLPAARARRARLTRAAARIAGPLRSAVLNAPTGSAVVALSLTAFGSYLGLFALAMHAAGVELPWSTALPLLALCLLATAIPINVGGWGPREAASTAAFAAAGINPEQGLAVGVLYGVLSLVAALPGLLALLPPRLSLRLPPRTQ